MPALVSVVSQVSLVILLLPANIAHPGLGEYMLIANHFPLKVSTKFRGSFNSTIVNLVNGHLNNDVFPIIFPLRTSPFSESC